MADAGGRKRVRVAGAEVRCDHVVVACGGYVERLFPRLRAATVPVATFVMTTAPLGGQLEQAIAVPHAIYDLQLATNYYRRLDDGRLLWGGRVQGWERSPAAIARLLRRDKGAMFPGLRDVPVEVAWGGWMSFLRHRMCVAGQTAPGVWYATGFGGHGLATTTLAGRLIAEGITGTDDRWRMFQQLGLPFAGGRSSRFAAQAVAWRQSLAERMPGRC